MNIYFCREWDEYAGLFVVAETRGKAKQLFAHEVDCHYCDVRSEVRKKNVDAGDENIIYIGSPLLKLFGLEYDEEDI